MKKNKRNPQNEIELINYTDFPVFLHWDFNKKQFEERALNKLSTRFNNYIEESIRDLKNINRIVYNKFFKSEEFLVPFLMHELVNAARYAYFGNASYENTHNPNGYAGGDESIQEQFTVWILDITTDDYRRDKGFAYSKDMYNSPVLYEWLKDSQFYKDVKKLMYEYYVT